MSEGNGLTDVEARLAAVNERRAKRDAEKAKLREVQVVEDLEAIADLEEELDVPIDSRFRVQQHVAGHPAVVGVRAPNEQEWKRYQQQVSAASQAKGLAQAQQQVAAHSQLAQVCWVFPKDPESRKVMLAANAALLTSVGNRATELAALKAEDEGKG